MLNDLSSQFEAQLHAQRQMEAADLAAAEATEVMLSGRLLSSAGTELELRLMNGETLRGTVIQSAATWLVLRLERAELLVWHRSLAAIVGLRAAPEWPSPVEARLTATKILREFAAAHVAIRFVTAGGTLEGYIQRVGQDFVDITNRGRQSCLPLAALLYVSCPR